MVRCDDLSVCVDTLFLLRSRVFAKKVAVTHPLAEVMVARHERLIDVNHIDFFCVGGAESATSSPASAQ